jgi:hypothetical protein
VGDDVQEEEKQEQGQENNMTNPRDSVIKCGGMIEGRTVNFELFGYSLLDRLDGDEFVFKDEGIIVRRDKDNYSLHGLNCKGTIAPGENCHKSRKPNLPSFYCDDCKKVFTKTAFKARRALAQNLAELSSKGPFDHLISPFGDVRESSSLKNLPRVVLIAVSTALFDYCLPPINIEARKRKQALAAASLATQGTFIRHFYSSRVISCSSVVHPPFPHERHAVLC